MQRSRWSNLALAPQALNPRARSTIRRSFVIYAALLLLLGWAFAVWYVDEDRTRTLAAAETQLRTIADSLLVQMEAMHGDGLGSAQSVLTDLSKRAPLADLSEDLISFELQEEVTGGYVRALFVGDESRTVIAGKHIAKTSRGVPAWLPRIPRDGETIVGLPTPDPSREGRRVIPLARGASLPSQHAWIGMWFDVEEFLARYQTIGIDRGAISIVSVDGWMLAGTAAPGRPAPPAANVASTALFEQMSMQPPGRARAMEEVSALSGKRKLYAVARVSADIPLLMVVSREYDAITEPWRRNAITVLWFSLGASALLIALTVLLYRFLREINRRESQFHKLFESSLVGIFLMKDGRIVEKNRQARRTFRVPDDDTLLGRRLDEISAELQHDAALSKEAIWQHYETLHEEGAAAFHWRFIRTDSGEPFEAEVHLSTIEVADESVTLVMVRDISEQEQAKRDLTDINAELESRVARRTAELQRANAELLASNRALEEFTGAASHDLRAPLGAISGQAGLLELTCGDALGDMGKQRLARIQQAVVRASDVISGLLSLASITRQTLRTEVVNLSEIAQTKLTELCEAEPERAIEVFIQQDMFVSADRGLMASLIGNLIGNAWKYSSKRAQVWIRFERMRREDGVHVYCVADRGAGFSREHAAGLFQAFRRLHSNEEFRGIGLGLATVQRIVSRYDGEIWAEAELNEGARFFFTLPNAQRALERGDAASDPLTDERGECHRSDQAIRR